MSTHWKDRADPVAAVMDCIALFVVASVFTSWLVYAYNPQLWAQIFGGC